MSIQLENHVLAIDTLGDAINAGTAEKIADLSVYLDDMFKNIEVVCDKRYKNIDSDIPRKVLIHIHGGLNTRSTTKDKAVSVSDKILSEDSEDWHYPIFITWPSGGLGSYGEHLFFLRKGRRTKGPGIILFPLYLITDLFKGVARSLISLPFQLFNDFIALTHAWTGKNIFPSWSNSHAIYKAVSNSSSQNISYNIVLGKYNRSFLSKVFRFIWYVLTMPFKLFMQIVILDAAAEGAWNAMRHRIRNLFRKPEEFDVREFKNSDTEMTKWLEASASGALVIFWDKIREFLLSQENKGITYKIDLVGHSMGAIVINQSIRYIPTEFLSNIVYMAPAATIRETSDSIIPVLMSNKSIEFYILVLHPMAEIEEINLLDFVPRGSLLEWIDNWYSTPPSHTYRRVGKWINVIQALHLFRDVRAQVFIKGFDVSKDTIPVKHGDFNNCEFWKKEFWILDGPLSYKKE